MTDNHKNLIAMPPKDDVAAKNKFSWYRIGFTCGAGNKPDPEWADTHPDPEARETYQRGHNDGFEAMRAALTAERARLGLVESGVLRNQSDE